MTDRAIRRVARVEATVRERVDTGGEESTVVTVKLRHRLMAKNAKGHRVAVVSLDGQGVVDELETKNYGLSRKIPRG